VERQLELPSRLHHRPALLCMDAGSIPQKRNVFQMSSRGCSESPSLPLIMHFMFDNIQVSIRQLTFLAGGPILSHTTSVFHRAQSGTSIRPSSPFCQSFHRLGIHQWRVQASLWLAGSLLRFLWRAQRQSASFIFTKLVSVTLSASRLSVIRLLLGTFRSGLVFT
jgi:hypothetical protein